MADVFVSYKAEDRKRVRPLVEALEADGLSVWWDAQIGGGAAWRHTIEAELNSAGCVIVVWSKRSVGIEGAFVQDEASRAQQRRVYVPVTLDKVHVPLGFGETQALPLTGWRGNRSDPRYQAVLAAAAAIIGGKAHRSPRAGMRAQGVDRRVVLGGAVGAVAIAGAGGWFLLKPGSAEASGGIAVLPFANLSSDPNQAYFSDGLAEELRSALSRIGLQVIGRTSSEAVKDEDARTAAAKLGVADILTGSVRKSPSTIRVSAQLIRGSNGVERWSQEYDRNSGDALKIETDIAQNVAQSLSVALGSGTRAALKLGSSVNAAAQDLYFKAREQVRGDDSEASWRNALGMVNAAIALDPRFADAWAEKSKALSELTTDYAKAGRDFDPGFSQAAAVAKQAILLAPDLAAAHVALATALEFQLHMSAALAEHQRAHALPDSDVSNLLGYSYFLSRIGDTKTGFALSKQAQVLDPLNPGAYAAEQRALYVARRYDESLRLGRKALEMAPALSYDRTYLVSALMHLGRYREASAELAKVPAQYDYGSVDRAILLALTGNRAASDQELHRLQQRLGDSLSWQYVEILSQQGERERALAALDRAWSIHDPGLTRMKADPWVDPIRSDPRFLAIEAKLNFPAV